MKKQNNIETIIDQLLEDEIFDMMDEFSKEDIYNIVKHNCPRRSKEMEDVFAQHFISPLGDTENTCEYFIKVNNRRDGSTLSLSNEYNTAVSRSLYYIFEPNKPLCYDNIKDFLDMLNEAWYAINE